MGTIANNDNLYGVAKWIVDPTSGRGTNTTIQAAITAASSGDTVFIRPGTYTENLTLKAGVNLTAFQCDVGINAVSNVTIIGKCSMTTAGTVVMSSIQLQTNSDFLLAVTGSAGSIVILNNCYLNCVNNTGISHTTSGGGAISLINCFGDLGTTGIAFYVGTSTGGIDLYRCNITNGGLSTTASTISANAFTLQYSQIAFPLSCSSTGSISSSWCLHACTALNTACIAMTGTGTSKAVYSNFGPGTASSITVGAGTTFQAYDCEFSGGNTNQITGAGTLQYSGLTFTNGASTVINPTTQTPSYTNLGKWKASGQPAFLYYLASNTAANVTGDGTQYTLGTDALTKVYDQSSNMTTGGTFTAPVTGLYQFNLTIQMYGMVAQTQNQIRIITTARTYIGGQESATIGVGGVLTQSFSVLADMTAADTATFIALSAGSTKTVGIGGSGSPYLTFISGIQLA